MTAATCDHVACSCPVEPGAEAYCSAHCARHAADGPSEADGCGCGHLACTSAVEPSAGAELERGVAREGEPDASGRRG